MKTLFQLGVTLLFFFMVLLFQACDHQNDENDNRDSCEEMAPDDVCVFDDEFSIRFVEVFADSRCPTDVVCVWEGQAEIELEYLKNDIVMKTDTLNVRPGMLEAGVGQFEKYHIELIKLDPYPDDSFNNIPQEDYRLTMNVSDGWFQAEITGANPSACPTICCGGFWIKIGDKTYTNYNYFDLSGEDPSTATFPIPVEIRYEHDVVYSCHVLITEIKN